MNKLRILGFVFFAAVLAAPALEAQSLKGMSLNGSTGLYSIPSGRIGWERSSDFGLDLGYHAIFDGKVTNIPKLGLSLFNWVELSAAFDIQPEGHITQDNGADFVGGVKIQFPIRSTALSVGGNIQLLNLGNDTRNYAAGQFYAAVTYAGTFFNMPAETTVVLGKSFVEGTTNWNIDFGMGFDMILLPNVFDRFVHWVTDFANFSYSMEAFSADSSSRGVLNTGLRIDLSTIPALSRFKFVVDIFITDALDSTRGFSMGTVFGIPIL